MKTMIVRTRNSMSLAALGAVALVTLSGCGSADTTGGEGQGGATETATGSPTGSTPGAASGSTPGSASGSTVATVFDNEADFNLVAEVKLQNRTVKFFEPESGVLLEVEKGSAAATQSAEESHLSGSALYEYLAKAPAPQALLDAEKRATAGQDDHSVDGAQMDQVMPEQKTWWTELNAGDPSTFRSRFCVATDRYYERLFRDGQTYVHTTGTNMMQAGVYSYDDLINYHGSYSGGLLLWDTALPAGWYLGWRVTSGVNRTAHSEVNSAPGVHYDHCVNYHF